MAATLKFGDILQVLSRNGVDFILVGGIAAILEGAPVSTFDLDVVIRRTIENHQKVLDALRELNAHYLDPAGRHIIPDAGKLDTMRLHRLLTDFGPLDVLESIGDGLTYGDLVDHTRSYKVAGFQVLTLNLETIILSKEQAHREKDMMVLPILYRTLKLKRAASSEEGCSREI
jgi:predicted nucleotidyltransferase